MIGQQKRLTPKQQYMVDQVIATMRIEDMEPSKECIDGMKKIISGEKTIEESIKELDMRYQK